MEHAAPTRAPRQPYATQCLSGRDGPAIAATDYIRAFPDQIRQWVPGPYRVLGTDGFGRSDTRAALRRFFEVDRHYVTVAALRELDPARAQEAIERYEVDPDAPLPTAV
jgi:pyruvate dehydrogenase E1 component